MRIIENFMDLSVSPSTQCLCIGLDTVEQTEEHHERRFFYDEEPN